MNFKKIFVIVSIAALVGSAMAQGGGGRQRGGRGGPMTPASLLGRPDVQKDLGITDEQKTKLTDIQAASRQKRTDARTAAGDDPAAQRAAMAKVGEETAKEQMAVLNADQQKRLKEIFVQLAKGRAVLNAEVQSDLGLTDEQKTKIVDLQKRQAAANAEIQAKVRDQSIDQAEARTEMQKNAKVLDDEIDKILTDAQKSKLKDMGGKPFTADLPAGGAGGGGGI